MARRFRKLSGDNVGLLLPSSVACDVALMGLYLAGKLPVVLNWTTGPANLAHAAKTMGLQHVVTSKAFIDRVGVQVAGDLKCLPRGVSQDHWQEGDAADASESALVAGPGSARRSAAVAGQPGRGAVHQRLGEGAQGGAPHPPQPPHGPARGIDVLQVTRMDSILGFLPAFHSFGMSITGLLPLLTGMRVVRHPDPTDAAALARKIGMYKPTILVGTPTFVSYILERAEPGELTSLRMVIVGAEKCPQIVFDRFAEASPGARVLEGYGITECSPVVSVNPPEANRPGTVGKPLPGVEVCVVDLESDQALPPGRMGMLLVSGPTIFPGYLGYDGPSPFRERDGKRWYVTGDLVEIVDGYIRFSGRLKRFIKAGGEMISLPALEGPFVGLYPPTKDGPRVAVEGVEIEGGGRRVVLFTTEAITLREANEVLLREGFQGVMRLDEVRARGRAAGAGHGQDGLQGAAGADRGERCDGGRGDAVGGLCKERTRSTHFGQGITSRPVQPRAFRVEQFKPSSTPYSSRNCVPR